jgi:DNA mismatch endonuclease (patch repair protein)
MRAVCGFAWTSQSPSRGFVQFAPTSPSRAVLVFVDGCFWHGCPRHGTSPRTNSSYWAAKIAYNRERDARQTAALEQTGWTVVRIWEHEPAAEAADRVCAALAQAAS